MINPKYSIRVGQARQSRDKKAALLAFLNRVRPWLEGHIIQVEIVQLSSGHEVSPWYVKQRYAKSLKFFKDKLSWTRKAITKLANGESVELPKVSMAAVRRKRRIDLSKELIPPIQRDLKFLVLLRHQIPDNKDIEEMIESCDRTIEFIKA